MKTTNLIKKQTIKKQIIKKAKCITIIGKQWYDKVNGNSYFSARVYVNNDLKLYIPFQYGYGSQYEVEAGQELKKQGYLPIDKEYSKCISILCRENNINYLAFISENCTQKDCKKWGKTPYYILNQKAGE
jgi:hypothetical protein